MKKSLGIVAISCAFVLMMGLVACSSSSSSSAASSASSNATSTSVAASDASASTSSAPASATSASVSAASSASDDASASTSADASADASSAAAPESAQSASASADDAASSAASSSTNGSPTIDYGTSEVFSHDDIDAAIEAVKAELSGWEGITIKAIEFTDDETCELVLENANIGRTEDDPEYTQGMFLLVSLRTPSGKVPAGYVGMADTDYEDLPFSIAHVDGGGWTVLSWGY